MVENGEKAFADAQHVDEDKEQDKRSAEMSQYVSVLLLSTFRSQAADLCTALAIFQSIAQEVFMFQQRRAAAVTGESLDTDCQDSEECATDSSAVSKEDLDTDDALY